MGESVRVLVIDDDEDDYVMIRDMLRDVGGASATVDWAPSYEAGLDDIRLAAHDVYLLDYRLGERTGLDLFGELNEHERDAPVILMSGHRNHTVDMTAMRDGFSDYIAKEQIEPSLLERSIRYAMTRKRMEAELRRRSEELETLVHVARILAEPGTFSNHLTAVLEELIRLLDVESADLRVPDEQKEGLVVVASVGSAQQVPGTFRAYDDSRTGRAFQTAEPIISHDYAANHRGGVGRGRRVRSGYVAQSVAWIPVKAAGEIVGVVAVDTTKPNHFTAERTRLLTAIVDGMGPFLEAAKLREAVQRDLYQLETTLAELRATQQQLIQSEKLAAVGTLISGVAHEINNPLGNILGRVQLLQRAAPDDRSRRGLRTVRDECERAIRIVRNLLSFTREHDPVTALAPLNDTLNEVLELRAYELRVSNIELRKHFQADLPAILADPHQLQQVFLNLVINAEQAMIAAHGGGVLSITTQRVGEALHVVVADDGPGIPDEFISQIFDPFFTTKEVGAGTGLGLSVCYGIVQEHGGELRVQSEEGKGTTFIVELPMRPQSGRREATAVGPSQQIWEK